MHAVTREIGRQIATAPAKGRPPVRLEGRANVDHADAQRRRDRPDARRERAHDLRLDAEDRRATGAAVDQRREE